LELVFGLDFELDFGLDFGLEYWDFEYQVGHAIGVLSVAETETASVYERPMLQTAP
jgi:hypothetical protein